MQVPVADYPNARFGQGIGPPSQDSPLVFGHCDEGPSIPLLGKPTEVGEIRGALILEPSEQVFQSTGFMSFPVDCLWPAVFLYDLEETVDELVLWIEDMKSLPSL
jgi:hypothetical protein